MSASTQQLTEEEKRQFNIQRRNFFKGTIAVIVTYGSIVLLMALGGIFSEKVRKMVFEDGFAFTVTLLSGIILIVLLLIIQIFTFGIKTDKDISTENIVCPDYWELKKTPENFLKQISDPKVRSFSRYYCEKPNASKPGINVSGIPAAATKELKAVKSIADAYNNITNIDITNKVTCERLYPDYMAYIDRKEFPEQPNKIRCEFIKHCADATATGQTSVANTEKIVWTGVCPNLA